MARITVPNRPNVTQTGSQSDVTNLRAFAEQHRPFPRSGTKTYLGDQTPKPRNEFSRSDLRPRKADTVRGQPAPPPRNDFTLVRRDARGRATMAPKYRRGNNNWW
jgi:hypothetical protein